MPSAKRKTNNIRVFERAFTRELQVSNYTTDDLAHSNRVPAAVLRDVIQRVAYSMASGIDSADTKFFTNTGAGSRKVELDALARANKLGRFLDRTIPTYAPHHQVSFLVQNDGSIWVRSCEQSGDGGGQDNQDGNGNDASSSSGSGTGNDNAQSSSDSGNGDSESSGSDSASGADSENSDGDGDPSSSESAPTEPAEPDVENMQPDERIEYESNKHQPNPDNQQENEFDKWWRMLAKLRQYCRNAAEDGLPIDDFETYRPGIMGAAMIREGLTADACADAATAHWADDAREELGIRKINPVDIVPPISDSHHPATGYLIRLLRARVPVMLHGGAGVGKTTLARAVADLYKLPFGMVSMTAGLSTTALTGSVNLQGFVTRPCIDTFTNGGVFLFDEMDAADPNLLLICNTMLANGEFQSPVTGERHLKHRQWFPIAAVNTLNGANTAYTGRSRLDHATMDRWRMGRIRLEFHTDLALEYALAELNGANNATA